MTKFFERSQFAEMYNELIRYVKASNDLQADHQLTFSVFVGNDHINNTKHTNFYGKMVSPWLEEVLKVMRLSKVMVNGSPKVAIKADVKSLSTMISGE